MAIETIYVVNHGGNPHEFKTQKEAEAFEARAGRCDRIVEILGAHLESHGLSEESMEKVAWYLAERERELASVFAEKGKKAPKGGATRIPRKAKAGTPAPMEQEVSAGQ